MDELQDAIEDSLYVQAVNDVTPAPIKKFPSANNAYLQSILNADTAIFNTDRLCQNSIGFYLVSRR